MFHHVLMSDYALRLSYEKPVLVHISKTIDSFFIGNWFNIHWFIFKADFQYADFADSASADFYVCAGFLAYPHKNFHHNADC